jgi:hypothetical protein
VTKMLKKIFECSSYQVHRQYRIQRDKTCIKMLVRKPPGKRRCGRPRRKLGNKIMFDLKKTIYNNGMWTNWLRTVSNGGL